MDVEARFSVHGIISYRYIDLSYNFLIIVYMLHALVVMVMHALQRMNAVL